MALDKAPYAKDSGTFPSGVVDPRDNDVWQRASQVALIGLFVIGIVWVLYASQQVIVPILLAWAIATVFLPAAKWMQEHGIPRVLAAILITILLLVAICALILLLSAPLTYWLGRAAYIGALLREKFQDFTQPLTLLQELRESLNVVGNGEAPALKVEPQSTSIVATVLTVLTPVVSQFVLFIGALLFYLIYRQKLRSALVLLINDRDKRLAVLHNLNDIDDHMTRYFSVFAVINICVGGVTAAFTWALGLPNPLLWGVLAAVLNYVPYLGPAIVIGTLFVAGVLVFPTLGEAVLAPLFFFVLNIIEGQFLTPTVVGHRLELNPFAIFLAIALCTWLWGPLGAFLAVPLLMVLASVFGRALGEEHPALPD
jgi:predicted PurR-regulated permease PerM